MTATILDGKALAATIKGQLAARVTSLKANGIAPGLGTVLVGDDPGSFLMLRENIATAKKSESTQFALI